MNVKRGVLAAAIVLLIANTHASSDEKKNLIFMKTIVGEIRDTEATKAGFRTALFQYAHLAFTDYDASDGETVRVLHGEFRTADEANRYFDWYVKKNAARKVNREDKVRSDGKALGRRAEFSLKSEAKKETWAVMWTEGVHSIEVTAPTLACAQEFERQARKLSR